MPHRVWKITAADEFKVLRLSRSLGAAPLLARLLVNRGVDSHPRASDFLCADLSHLPSPERMADLPYAVYLIQRALKSKQRILIVGDYDVDGLTGTALLYRVLLKLGGNVSWHIPHRVIDGYGLRIKVIQEAAHLKVKLLIAVDCGTTSFEELSLARRLGIWTIVVDHHELLKAKRPPAAAFLNPLQPGCRYPNKDLASVGVAFTLARGLLSGSGPTGSGPTGPGSMGSSPMGAGSGSMGAGSRPSRIGSERLGSLGARDPKEVWEHLDLVALGTLADLAPLVGENRILVKRGLNRLTGTLKPGLKSLISRARLEGRALTAEDVSFKLAPPLNAMGRTGDPSVSLRLLITEDPKEAEELSKRVNRENRERALKGREAVRRAFARVEREVNFSRDWVMVLEDERWHPGLVGIVASRLVARFHRPAVVIAVSGETAQGSARSIAAFNLVEALEEVKELLMEFGGHPAAAGLRIARDKIPAFREALNRVARRQIDPRQLIPSLEVDGELPLAQLTEPLLRELQLLAPFGPGNSLPVFVSHDARFPAVPKRGAFHPRGISWKIEDAQGRPFEVLQPKEELWDGWDLRRIGARTVRLAYSPVCRQEDAEARVELRLHDLK